MPADPTPAPPPLPAPPSENDLFDEAPCGLLVTALDGTILKVNRTFCDWIGVAREALVGRRRLQELFTMGGRIFHQTHWVPSLQMQGSLAEVKFELRHSDGRLIPMIINARRRRRAEGQFDEVAAFVAEDRHRYERELMSARKRADALLQEVQAAHELSIDRALFAEQMVGIVSHDLRNPLSAILTGIRVLDREPDRRSSRVLGHLRSSAERAQRLIEELLDFTQARIGTGLAVNLEPADLHELTAATVEELRMAFPTHAIDHHALGTQGGGACVMDADRLAQLIGNLVGNAAAYGRDEAPIRVTSKVGDDSAEIAVHNEGAPIPPETLATLFDPMVRGAPGKATNRSVGLGLFIVREIAKAHGGDVAVRSSADDGTTFTMRFPCTAPSA